MNSLPPIVLPTPVLSTGIAAAVGGVTALWGLFGGPFEPVGFFALISAFAVFAALARALASFRPIPWPHLVGGVMSSLVATWMTCLLSWDQLRDSPPLLAALAVASGLVGSEIAERLARYITQRWGVDDGQR